MIQPTLVFPEYLLKKHLQHGDAYGILIGWWSEQVESKIHIVNIIRTGEEFKFSTLKEELESRLPVGFDAVGLWKTNDELLEEDVPEWAEMMNLPSERCHLVLMSGGPPDLKANILENSSGGSWILGSQLEISMIDSSLNEESRKKSVSLRLKINFDLEIQVINENGDLRSELSRSFDRLEQRFNTAPATLYNDENSSHLTPIIFKTKQKNVIFEHCSRASNFTSSDLSINQNSVIDLYRLLNPEDNKKTKNKDLLYTQDLIDFTLLEDLTVQPKKHRGPFYESYVPVIHYECVNFASYVVKLRLNAMVVCSQDTSLQHVHNLICNSLVRQIRCARNCSETFSDFADNKIVAPVSHFFIPRSHGHPLMLCYPSDVKDENLTKLRRDICQLWNLSTDMPCIRRLNRYLFPLERGPYLRSVHRFGSSSGINDGVCVTVCGDYEYRHYMQDNFNDSGWGCAYRSFQTVWSWFVLQGYIEKSVPSHREIQQALVDIGDRPANFVGTKQWIGSLELSYCLSHMLNIESKILNVSIGSDLASKARELIAHFQIERTPVMIGGGVLAHTILGVHYCELSGDAKFLVLDPHYTGEENIKTIVDKGWCGWKPPNFWSTDAFYNLLLPQRPRNVI